MECEEEPSQCTVGECDGKGSNEYPGILFPLPENEEMLTVWLSKIGKPKNDVKKTSKICSKHFETNYICKGSLVSGSVPTLHFPPVEAANQSRQEEADAMNPSTDSNESSNEQVNSALLNKVIDPVVREPSKKKQVLDKNVLDTAIKICIKMEKLQLKLKQLCLSENLFVAEIAPLLIESEDTAIHKLLKRASESSQDQGLSGTQLRNLAFCLYKTSPRSYELLRQSLKLPPINALQGVTVKLRHGFFLPIAEYLSEQVKLRPGTASHAVLYVTVLKTSKLASYDYITDEISGIYCQKNTLTVTSSNVIIYIKGLVDDWEQIIFNQSLPTNDTGLFCYIIETIVSHLCDIRIRAIVLPIELLGLKKKLCCQDPNLECFLYKGFKHFCLIDIRCSLQYLAEKLLESDASNVSYSMCGKYIQNLFDIECKAGDLRLAPSLKEVYFDTENTFKKRQAHMIFQYEVRAALNFYMTAGQLENACNVNLCIKLLESVDRLTKLAEVNFSEYNSAIHVVEEIGQEIIGCFNNVTSQGQKLYCAPVKISNILKHIKAAITTVSHLRVFLSVRGDGSESFHSDRLSSHSLSMLKRLQTRIDEQKSRVSALQVKDYVNNLVLSALFDNFNTDNDDDEITSFIEFCKKLESVCSINLNDKIFVKESILTSYEESPLFTDECDNSTDYNLFRDSKVSLISICGHLFYKCVKWHQQCSKFEAFRQSHNEIVLQKYEECRKDNPSLKTEVPPVKFIQLIEKIEQSFQSKYRIIIGQYFHVGRNLVRHVHDEVKRTSILTASDFCSCFPILKLIKYFVKLRLLKALPTTQQTNE